MLRVSAFHFRTERVSLVASFFLLGSSSPDSLSIEEFFVSICPSTDSDMISTISESANPASFKASMLSRSHYEFLISKIISRCSAKRKKKNREKLRLVKIRKDKKQIPNGEIRTRKLTVVDWMC